MAYVSGIGYSSEVKKVLGNLIIKGARDTPFMTLLGAGVGESIGGIVPVNLDKNHQFAMGQVAETNTPVQNGLSEVDLAAAGTPSYTQRSEETNVIQIEKEDIELTDVQESINTSLFGIAVNGAEQIVQDEMAFQTKRKLVNLRKNYNYSFLGGTKAIATGKSVAGNTGGVLTGVSTHLIDLTGSILTKAQLDIFFGNLWDDGVDLTNSVIVCDVRTSMYLTDLYGAQPQREMIGGLMLNQIITGAGATVSILLDQAINTSQANDSNKKYMGLVDLNVCSIRGLVDSKTGSAVYMKRTAEVGASQKRMIIAQLGIDYGAEHRHGLVKDFIFA